MKKFLLGLLLLAGSAWAQTTPNIGLFTPARGTLNWDVQINANFIKLDQYLGGVTPLPGNFAALGSLSARTYFIPGIFQADPCCDLQVGTIYLNLNSLNNSPHLHMSNGDSTASALLTAADNPGNMANGTTGTGATVLQNAASLFNPNIGDATGTSLTLNLQTGDLWDLQQGAVTPFIQATPQAGHLKVGYGSDNKLQASYDGDNFAPIVRQGPFVTSDFTTANNTSLQAIPALTFTKSAVATKSTFRCQIMYSQATANAAVAFGIQAVTASPTNISADGLEQTNTTAFSAAALIGLASTTATNIVSATPAATATVFRADLTGTIEDSAHANTFNILVSTATGADAVTIKRGSYCEF